MRTPVTETYNQMGKVQRAIFLCEVKFELAAKPKVIKIIGRLMKDNTMCEIKMKK